MRDDSTVALEAGDVRHRAMRQQYQHPPAHDGGGAAVVWPCEGRRTAAQNTEARQGPTQDQRGRCAHRAVREGGQGRWSKNPKMPYSPCGRSIKTYAGGNNDAPGISKYGSLVRPDAQIVALRTRCAKCAP